MEIVRPAVSRTASVEPQDHAAELARSGGLMTIHLPLPRPFLGAARNLRIFSLPTTALADETDGQIMALPIAGDVGHGSPSRVIVPALDGTRWHSMASRKARRGTRRRTTGEPADYAARRHAGPRTARCSFLRRPRAGLASDSPIPVRFSFTPPHRYSVLSLPQVVVCTGVSPQTLASPGVGEQPVPCGSVVPT